MRVGGGGWWGEGVRGEGERNVTLGKNGIISNSLNTLFTYLSYFLYFLTLLALIPDNDKNLT